MLQDLLNARGVLLLLIQREFRARYAGSNLGIFWNIAHPIIVILTYLLVFAKLMGSRMPDGAGGPFAFTVHLTAGIIPWFFFSEIVSRSCNVLVENAGMLKKMAIPEEVLFFSVFATAFTVHGISLLALILLLLVLGVPLDPLVVLAFPVMVALGIVGIGLGMVLAVLNLLIRDVAQFVTVGLNLGFWSLPIVYVPSILPDKIESLMRLNPLYGFFTVIQMVFGSPAVREGFQFDFYYLLPTLPFAAFVIGRSFLKRHRPEILDAL